MCQTRWSTHSDGSFAELDPTRKGEVGWFGAIVAMIIPGMVRVWKGNHEFASFLGYFIEWYRIFFQNLRWDQSHFVAEECRTLFEAVGEET